MKSVFGIRGTRWEMLGGVALALVACGGAPTPQASNQPTVQTVRGKVSGWQGEGRVTVPGLPGVTSSVGADGTFVLTLPGDAEVSGQTVRAADVAQKLGCSGSVQSSDSEARAFALLFLDTADSAGTRQTSAITGSKTGLLSRQVNARMWVYSDSATQLRGTMDCANLLGIPQIPELPITVAVNARPGWNVVELNIEASANASGQVSASGSMANSTAGGAQATFRTTQELQAQIAF